MTITVNTKAYTQDLPTSKDSCPYVGPGQTGGNLDKFDLYRTYPKATATFSGVNRTRVKLSRTLTLTGALSATGPAVLDLSINIPVGAASADVDSLLSDLAAGLGQQWAKDLAKNLDVTA